MRRKSSVSQTPIHHQTHSLKTKKAPEKKGLLIRISTQTVKQTSDNPHSACSLMRRICESGWYSK